ncbi:MAG TPA: hypothetical protein VII11_10210 [Bacteroidota bacterium]
MKTSIILMSWCIVTVLQAQVQSMPNIDSQDSLIAEIEKRIAGKENIPAEEVFKNIQNFKGLPAGRIPRIMSAFARSLGVGCSHCHVIGELNVALFPLSANTYDSLGEAYLLTGDKTAGKRAL